MPTFTHHAPVNLSATRPSRLSAILLSIFVALFAFDVDAASKRKGKSKKRKKAPIVRVIPDLTKDGKPNVQSRQAVVIDLDSDEILWARQPDALRPIASISKLMASLVVLDSAMDIEAVTTMTETDVRVARGGAKSRLLPGYRIKNHDLLRAALLASDNRAISAMGRSVGMDAVALAAAMTRKAKAIGLKNTRFGDPTGLDPRNVSTPREVVKLLREAMKNPTLEPIMHTSEYDLPWERGQGDKAKAGQVHYINTNRLIRGSPYKILGGKTGYTDEAKYCLVTAGEVHGRRIAVSLLNGDGELTRFGDFKRIAKYLEKNPPPSIAAPAPPADGHEGAAVVPFAGTPLAPAPPASLPFDSEDLPAAPATSTQ
ncbi:MAG: D-alanyl-D-alanine carboxypeptidase [Myxococcales bacterium]|nr:D-alanyl-D-alanine carboxypeptidase [Myxococcales bacterium]